MPAGYAATTQIESTFGDVFTAEISNLRVAERLPWTVPYALPVPPGYRFHLMPNPPFSSPTALSPMTRRPSNIIPIKTGADDPHNDVFYLGLDLEFVGTRLGQPAMPDVMKATVQFYLEAYGTGVARQEINIAPQVFTGLNANPSPGTLPDTELRHQLWVEVSELNFPAIVAAPAGLSWDDLFNPDTIYRVAASVKLEQEKAIPYPGAILNGFIEGLVMQTEAWNAGTVPVPQNPPIP